MQDRIFIVLVNYKGWSDTIESLESILKLKNDNFQIIIVDNNSQDESIERIKSWALGNLNLRLEQVAESFKKYIFPEELKPVALKYIHQNNIDSLATFPTEKIILIEAQKNKGFAAGNNIAIDFISTQDYGYVWFLNNDTVVTPTSLINLVEANRKEKNQGITGSVLLFYHNPKIIQAVGGKLNLFFGTGSHILENSAHAHLSEKEKIQIDYPVGASMLVKEEFIRKIGGMNESYFLYYEEIDWVIRGKREGFSISYASNSIVYHKEGASIGIDHKKKSKSSTAEKYSLRNRIKFTKLYYPFYLPTVYLGLVIAVLNRLRKGQFSKAVAIIGFILKK